jgi:site-specific recombinase
MLGSAGFVGLILGLPIDIRHITFAAANMAYGIQAHEFMLSGLEVAIAAVGVFLIGMVNLGVSFSLAFFTALRARGVRKLESLSLAGRIFKRFFTSPGEFFYPPKETGTADNDLTASAKVESK